MTVVPAWPEDGNAVSQSLPFRFRVHGHEALSVNVPVPPVDRNVAFGGEIAYEQFEGCRMEKPVELILMDPTRSTPVVLAATV